MKNHYTKQWSRWGGRSCFFAALLSFSLIAKAQTYVNGFGYGAGFNDYAYDMVQDDDYNIYVTGSFTGTIDFDPSTATANLNCPMAPCGYVAKYDSAGNYQWAINLQSRNAPTEPRVITLDNSGNLCVAGWFMDSTDFDPSVAVARLGAMGAHDAFIAKYDVSGNYLWAKSFGGPAPDMIYGMDIDKDDNIVVAGTYIAFADFDPSPATATLNANGGSPDIFFAKYDASGNYIWAQSIGGPNVDEAWDVKVDTAGNVLLTGFFTDNGDFDPSAGLYPLVSNGLRDAIIGKYDPSGAIIWAHGIGSAANDAGKSIQVDEAGDFYVTGNFAQSTDFDPSSGGFSLLPVGGDDVFLAKYDKDASFNWAKGMGGGGGDVPNQLVLVDDQLYLTGKFQAVADFDGGAGTTNLNSAGGSDVFMTKYDTTGNFVWAERIGGGGDDIAYALAVEDKKNIYLTGTFSGIIDLDPSATAVNITSNGSEDVFVGKYNFCTETTGTESVTICKGDVFLWNGVGYANAGTYEEFLTNAAGCDSTAILELEVDSVENYTVSKSLITITVSGLTATYQWIDCNNGNAPIAGETSASFTATANGSYAVVVSQGLCLDTSACVTIDSVGVGIAETSLKAVRNIFPNPSNGTLIMELNKPGQINIYNALGEFVYEKQFTAGRHEVDLGHLPEGVYFLTSAEHEETIKLVLIR